MPFTEPQQRAIRRARAALDTARAREFEGTPQGPEFWCGWLESALAGLLTALGEDDGEDPSPCPAVSARGPGWCTCGAHVTRTGEVIPAGAP